MRIVSSFWDVLRQDASRNVLPIVLHLCWCFALAIFLAFYPLHAQVSFTAGAGLTQSQNFNTIGNSATATLPSGWRVGAAAATTFAAAGTAVTRAGGTSGAGILTGASAGGSYNFANGITASSADRSVGFLSSGGFPAPYYLYVETQNNSAQGITGIQVQYIIEKYRSGSREWTITLETSPDGTTWTSHAAGTDVYPADANNTTVSNPPLNNGKNVTVTGLAIPIGGTLYLRWSYVGTGGTTNGQGLGIDDVTLTAINGVIPASAVYSATDFPEAAANNGTITQTRTITLSNAQWLNAITNGTQLTPTTHFTTANVPPGMTLTVTKNSNTQVTVALTGTATNHAVANNINNLTLTFQDAVIEGGTHLASAITGLNRNNLTVTFLNPPSRIRAIQGAQHRSPFVGQLVNTVPGIVTAVRDNGFFIQDPTDDSDVRTSEGMFIFTNAAPPGTIAVGDSVHVSGTVIEFRTSNPDGLTLTEIGDPGLVITEQVTPTMTISPTPVGSGGRTIPTNTISDDAPGGDTENPATLFDPTNDGLDFWESLEGMLVRVNDAVIVSTASSPIAIVADNGANATGRTTRGGVAISANDDNPERLYLIRNDNSLATPGNRQVGDRYPGAMIGVIEYSSDVYRLRYTQTLPTVVPSVFTPEVTALTGDANRLTVATFNAYNMNPASGHIAAFATQVVNGLRSPDIIGLEEIQDNSGPTNNGVVAANLTLDALTAAIQAAGGPAYSYRQIDPANNSDGGAPGANIRVAVLFNPNRVRFIDRGTPSAINPTAAIDSAGQLQLSISPGRIDPANAAWAGSRKPLASEFEFNGRKVFVIVAHFNSKGGDGPSFGRNQPPIFSTEAQRIQQATAVNSFVNSMLTRDPLANIVVVGDMNEHEFRPPMLALEGSSLYNLVRNIPINDRYTYNFNGNSQVLDNILVTHRLRSFFQSEIDIVHLNADVHESIHVTDHDAVLARIDFTPPTVAPPSGSVVGNVGATGPRIDSFSPQYGLRGTIVTILGAGFTGATSVSFGGTPALSFQVVSDNLIYATVSGGSSGAVNVITTQNSLSLNGFIFGTPPLPPPSITSITPTFAAPGDTLVINGQFFEQVSNVTLGGQPMSFTLVNGQLRVIVGTVAPGNQSLQLLTASGTSAGNTISVQALPEARIFRISPSVVQASDQSAFINAEGANLSRMQAFYLTDGTSATVQYRTGLSAVAAGMISFSFPPELQTGGIKRIQFVNADGAVISVTLAVVAAPSPRFASPVVSTSASSNAFTIRLQGTGFMRNADILLNGSVPVRAFVESTTALIVEIPRELNTFEETHRIRIINPDKQSTETTVRVERGNLPYITNVSVRLSNGMFILTITGARFHRNILGLLNTVPLQILSADSTRISAQISSQAMLSIATQNVLLYLVNPNNTSIGVWLPKTLFEEAGKEAAAVHSIGINGGEKYLLSIAETIARPAYLTVANYSTPDIEQVIIPSKQRPNEASQRIDRENIEIAVQPNPGNDVVVVKLPASVGVVRIMFVTNLRGEKVLEAAVSPEYADEQIPLTQTLDIHALPTGTYIVHSVGTNNKVYRGKFVIMR